MATTGERVRARTWALGVLALVLVLLSARAAVRPGVDLHVFHSAGARFAAATELYAIGGSMPYRYAPGIAAMFVPLAALPFPVARALWAVAGAALAFGVAVALDRRLGRHSPFAAPLAWLVLVQPLAQELSYGQVDLLVLVLALASFALDERGHELPAGALVAIAIGLKIAPAVLALDWIVRRRWRPFAGAALAGIALVLVTLARYGLAAGAGQHLHWFESQVGDVRFMVDAARNQSLWAMARSAGLGNAGGAAACAAFVALALPLPPQRRRLLLLAMIPLVSGYGWPQLFLFAVPLLAEVLARGGPPAWVAGSAAALVSLLSYDVAGQRVEDWSYEHRIAGVLLAVAIVAARLAPAVTAGPRVSRWGAPDGRGIATGRTS